MMHFPVAIIDLEYQLPLSQAQALLCDLQREAKRHPESLLSQGQTPGG